MSLAIEQHTPSKAKMITRSKARAMRQAQHNIKSQNARPTHASLEHPCRRIDEIVPQSHQPDQVLASSHDQVQLQQAELEAALIAAITQMAAEQNQAVMPGATTNQRLIDEPFFDAAALEHLATVRARLDLMRTSCKIAWEYFRVTTMACQASTVVQQRVMLISSCLVLKSRGHWLGVWPGIVAVSLLVTLLHLLNVLCVRRIWRPESLAERVATSAALFLTVGGFLKEKLEWLLILQF